jgi:hypothetical protein
MNEEQVPYEIASSEVFEPAQDRNEFVPELNKQDLLNILDEMILSYDRLPRHAQESFATNADLQAVLLLLSEILRAD